MSILVAVEVLANLLYGEVEGSGIFLMGPGFSPLEIKCLLSSRNSIILKE